MVTVYWKGGNAGTGSQQNDPDNRLNWVTASGGSTAIDATPDFAGLANGTTDVVIDYATSGTTHCLVVSGTNKKVWKSLTINYHASLSKILYINATTLTLSGLDVNKGKTIFSSGTGIIKFTGVPKFTTSNSSSPNMYVKINSSQDISFNTDIESGMFFDNLTRLNITFLFEPPNNTILVLSNGIYPHMDFDCASTDLALLSTEELPIADKYNSYSIVDMLNLDVDTSFNIIARTYLLKDYQKHIRVTGTLTLTTSSIDMGYATFEYIPINTTTNFPVSGTTTYGATSGAGEHNFESKFHKIIIGASDSDVNFVTIENNLILTCNSFTVRGGGRIYGPDWGDSNSAEIHCIQTPVIEGDWNFSQISEGIYRTSGTSMRLPVSVGGTGLNTIPSKAILYGDNRGALGTLAIGNTGEVLAVKSDGTLEWSASAGGSGSFAVSDITGATALTSALATTDELVLSDNGVLKRMDISVLQNYMQSELSFVATSVLAISNDTDGEFTALTLTNRSDAADTTGKVSVLFNLEDTSGTAVDSAKILVEKKQSFTSTASTQDSRIKWHTSVNGTLTEGMSLTGTSLDVEGGLEVKGGSIDLTNGSYITSASAGTLLLNEDIVKTSGDLLVGGNDIKASDGTTAISLSGNDVTIAGDLTVNGDSVTVNTATLSVEDPLIILASGNNGADSVDIGFYGLYDTSGSQDLYAGLFRDANDSGKFKLFKDLQTAPTTTVNVSGTGYAIGTLVANLEGNATTATTATLASTVTLASDNGDASHYVTFADAATNAQALKTDDQLVFNPASGRLTANMFVGDVTGDVAGDATGLSVTLAVASGGTGVTANTTWLNAKITSKADGTLNYDGTNAVAPNHNSLAGFVAAEHIDWAGANAGTIHSTNIPTLNQSTTGNAATATKLATARAINGVNFDGSANITVTADATTLTGTSLKSTVVGSSLTSVGTLTSLTATGTASNIITRTAGYHSTTHDGSLRIKGISDTYAITLVLDADGDTTAGTDGDDKVRVRYLNAGTTKWQHNIGDVQNWYYDTNGSGSWSSRMQLTSAGTLSATAFSGPLTGNVTGNVSGTAATVTGATQSAITTVGGAFTITGSNAAALNITATDGGGSPAQSTFINMTGYGTRGQGIRFFDANASGEEWFTGLRYSGGFDEYMIGYDASGGASEYLANALLQVNKNGNVTATTFVGALTGNVTGNVSGTAATVTGAAQTAITSVGTLTALQVDNININGNTISSTNTNGDITITPNGNGEIIRDGYKLSEVQIRDARNDGDITPNSHTAYAASFHFTDDITSSTNSWDAVMTMRGWGNDYAAWQIFSSASSESDDASTINQQPLYFRSGQTASWGTIRQILTYPGVLPSTDGSANQFLRTDGSGTVTWESNVPSATLAATVTVAQDNTADAAHFINFTDDNSGANAIKVDTGLTYNPSSNMITATRFEGALIGNADTVTNGVYTTGNQTIAGVKTLSSYAVLTGDATATTGNNDVHLGSSGGTSNALKIKTASGDLVLGPQSTSWNHMMGSANKFYFNKPIVVDGNGTFNLSSYSTEDLILSTNSGTETRMTIKQNTGNVGIGTTTPLEKLHVEGDIRSDGTFLVEDLEANYHMIQLTHTNASADYDVGIHWQGSPNTLGLHNAYGDVNIRGGASGTLSTPHLTVKGDGKVGIGTTAPNTKLHVESADEVGLSVDSSHSIGSTISLDATATGGDEWRLISAADGAGTTNGTGAFGLYNIDVSAYRLVVEGTTGHVGIGVTAPEYKLDVQDGSIRILPTISSSVGTAIRIGARDNGNDITLLRVDGEGGGEGTGNTGESDSAKYGFSMKYMGSGSGEGNRYAMFMDNQVGSAIEAMSILQGGNVGIGTATPTHKLQVNGSFTATTKEFTISHPSKKGMTLSHGSLEGPEFGVYVRGKSKDRKVYLPDYWKDLVHEDSITVQLTSIGKSENLYVVDYNTEYIEVENDVEYFYYVQAERKDVDKLEVET